MSDGALEGYDDEETTANELGVKARTLRKWRAEGIRFALSEGGADILLSPRQPHCMAQEFGSSSAAFGGAGGMSDGFYIRGEAGPRGSRAPASR